MKTSQTQCYRSEHRRELNNAENKKVNEETSMQLSISTLATPLPDYMYSRRIQRTT